MTNSGLEALWASYGQMPFPPAARGVEVQGIDLVLLDSLISGCVSSLVDSGAPRDSSKLALLADLAQQLRGIAGQLDGETKRYFDALDQVAEATLLAAKSR